MKNRTRLTISVVKKLGLQKCLFLGIMLLTQWQLFSQQSYTFTSASATGSVGPTQTQLNSTYLSTNLNGFVTSSLGIQSWTVPVSGSYLIDASGAAGGDCAISSKIGGFGARIQGEFFLNAGTIIQIIVGQKGETGCGTGGGGGGTYVVANGTLLIAAGGGGGSSEDQNGVSGTTLTAGTQDFPPVSLGGTLGLGGQSCQTVGTNGGAGGGYFSGSSGNGADGSTSGGGGGKSFLNGGLGGVAISLGTLVAPAGGFGGGGGGRACTCGGGGGGGYSGGAGGQQYNNCVTTNTRGGGGAGGSFNSGANQINTIGYQSGAGRVIIIKNCDVNITSSATNSLEPVICSGNSLTLSTNAIGPFTWFSGNTTNTSVIVTPSITTTYSITGTGSLSCQAAAFITVTVSSGLPVLSISNPSSNICLGRIVSLTATGALTYTWTGGAVNGQTFTPTSTQLYTVSGQNGCGVSTATTAISISPLPVNVTASPTLVCEGYPSTLTAQSALNGYTWQPVYTTGSLNVVSPLANTVYTVTASDGTCVSVATVSVATKTTPTITSITTSSSICSGESVVLTASGGSTYTWTPGNLSGSTITVTPTSLTLYSVDGTNGFGCDASSYQLISVTAIPTIAIHANKTLVCTGDPIILTASGVNSYSWTNGPLTPTYTVNPTSLTIYTVSGLTTGNNCVGTTTILVNAITPNASAVATPTAICSGFTTTLAASGANSYTWTGFTSSPSQVVTPLTTSVYTLVAHTLSGTLTCSSINTVQVLVHADPTITVVSSRSFICEGESEILTASGAVSYTWSVSSAATASILVNPNITTTYSIYGTDAKGCANSNSISIVVDPCSAILKLNNKNKGVLVYPNPSNGEVTIETESDINLQLLNYLGEQIKVFYLVVGNHHKVVITDLANGIYFVVGENTDGKINQKIVVVN